MSTLDNIEGGKQTELTISKEGLKLLDLNEWKPVTSCEVVNPSKCLFNTCWSYALETGLTVM